MTERACGLAGFKPRIAVQTMDFAAQLELVSAGVGVALAPHLTVGALGDVVMLARPSPQVSRQIFACIRTAAGRDEGLRRLIALLGEAAVARVPAEAA